MMKELRTLIIAITAGLAGAGIYDHYLSKDHTVYI